MLNIEKGCGIDWIEQIENEVCDQELQEEGTFSFNGELDELVMGVGVKLLDLEFDEERDYYNELFFDEVEFQKEFNHFYLFLHFLMTYITEQQIDSDEYENVIDYIK